MQKSTHINFILFFLVFTFLGLHCVFLIVSSLNRSFWLDELSTVIFVADKPLFNAILDTINNIHSGWVYAPILWALSQISNNEIIFRLPSVIFTFGGLAILNNLLKNTFNLLERFALLVTLINSKYFLLSMLNARPYGLATLLSFYLVFLVSKLCVKDKKIHFVKLSLTSILLPLIHPMYTPTIIIGLFLALLNRSAKSLSLFLIEMSAFALGLIVSILTAFSLKNRVSLVSTPSFLNIENELIYSFYSDVLLIISLIVISSAYIKKTYYSNFELFEFRPLWTYFMMWIIPLGSIFTLAYITGNSVLINDRYFVISFAGFILLLAYVSKKVFSSIIPLLLLTFISASTIVNRQKDDYWKQDWREAVQYLKTSKELPDSEKIFLISGHIESQSPQFLLDSTNYQLLSSPINWYSSNQDVEVLPPLSEQFTELYNKYPRFKAKVDNSKAFYLMHGGNKIEMDRYLEIISLNTQLKCSVEKVFKGVTIGKCSKA